MNDSAIAKRYAQALMLLAQDEAQRDALAKDLDYACDGIYQNQELLTVYTGVQFANIDKKNVVTAVFKDQIGETVIHFLLLLVDKMRTSYLADIRQAYHALSDTAKGIEDAVIYSAFDLTDETVTRMATALSSATGKTIRLKAETDSSLLAGIRIRYGDYVIDGSAKARLAKMRSELTRNDK